MEVGQGPNWGCRAKGKKMNSRFASHVAKEICRYKWEPDF
jgi:hypothetical protein